MFFKFIQVNIYKGKYLGELIDFIKKEDPDFISMQEVTINGFNLYKDKNVNLFEVLKEKLGLYGKYHGDLKLAGDKRSVFGNAVFSKLPIYKSTIGVLKKFRPVTVDELDGISGEIREQIDRHFLDCEVHFGGRKMHILCWHGAWTAPPHDTDETWKQANMVYDHLCKIKGPFVLGGDLNAIMDSKTIDLIGRLGKNLMPESGALVTTNLKVHKIAPRGFLVDYIFTSLDIKTISVRVPEITVSDHLPVIAELEI